MQINHQVRVSNFASDFKLIAKLKQKLYSLAEERKRIRAALTAAEDVKKHMYQQMLDKNSQLDMLGDEGVKMKAKCDDLERDNAYRSDQISALSTQVAELRITNHAFAESSEKMHKYRTRCERLEKELALAKLQNIDIAGQFS